MTDDDLAAMLRALSHPVRLHILRILAARAETCCCTDVTDCLPLAQSTVSQHLKVLLDAGVIERRAHGTRNHYRVRTDRLATLARALETYVGTLGPQAAPCEDRLEEVS